MPEAVGALPGGSVFFRAMKCRRDHIALAAIVGLALVLRLLRLDWQGAWWDELFSMIICTQPVGEMMRSLVSDYVHPPLHYLLLRVWMDLIGFAPFQARLLSVVFGVLAVLAIYKLASHLFDRRTGLIAALLLAVSQLGVKYSQEARPYEQLLFLTLVAVWLFAIALFERRGVAWWAFVATAVLTVYTSYFGILPVVALAVFSFIWRREYRIRLSWWVSGAVVAALLYAPWLASGVISAALHNPKIVHGAQISHVSWSSVFAAVNWFNNGKYSGFRNPSPLWTFVAGGLLLSLPVLLSLRLLVRSRETPEERARLWLLVLSFAGSLAVIPVLGLARIQYDIRYVAFCVGFYYIMAARGLVTLRNGRMRVLWVAAVLLYGAGSLRANYFIPYKEEYREALEYLSSSYREGDCVVHVPSAGRRRAPLAWTVYYGTRAPLRVELLKEVASGEVHCGRVWLVRDTFRLVGARARGEDSRQMLSRVYEKVEERRYVGMEVILYEPMK